MIETLSLALAHATELPQDEILRLLARPKELKLGDFALPCFPLAKLWKVSPPAAAAQIKERLVLPDHFERVEIVGPYLNFFINRTKFTEQTVNHILDRGLTVGSVPAAGRPIVLEYSSPNIAKVFHVGHLRTTLLGLALERLYKHRGYDVTTINHLGDWGTQFGFVWAGCELYGRPKEWNVDGLVESYVKATNLKTAQAKKEVGPEDADKPDVNEMAREYFKRLEADEPTAIAFWRECLDTSIDYIKAIYDRLDIHFDHYTGESFYRNMLSDVEEKIRASGILEESEGALGVNLGEELGFVRVFAEDGRSLYITRDIAAAMYRHETFRPERSLYVVAAQQSLHFKQLIGVLQKMGHPSANEIVHVPFGFVPGMKTREGKSIPLEKFLDEAKQRALTAYREEVSKRPEGLDEEEISEKVAIGATYFYFLNHSNIKDFQFSWTEALAFQGDTGPYVQYALGRLNSIESKAREVGIVPPETVDASKLVEEEAYELVSILARFDETLEKAVKDFEPSLIAQYALDLARAFSKAYRGLRVIGEEESLARPRLALFTATKYVLHTALTLIGVPPVEKM